MPPLDFRTPGPMDPTGQAHLAHGPESLVREIQNQVGAAASMPMDKALSLSPMPGADLAAAAPGVVPGGEQALSPLMNMIMKMPGHISLFSSFFEALGNFLMPQLDMLTAFDPANMGLGLDSLFSPEHIGLDFSLLPDDAPIFGTLDAPALNFHSGELFGSKLTSFGQSSHSGFSLAKEIGLKDNLNVSGNLMGKPQYEGALSGPSLSEGGPASHLAANDRLFSDNMGEPSSNFGNNIASQTSSTVNVNGSTFAQLPNQTATPAPTLPSNQGLDFFGKSDNLLASNPPNHNAFESTVSPRADQSQDLGGLSAKPLSLDKAQNLDMKAADVKHIDTAKHVDAKHLDTKHLDTKHLDTKHVEAKADKVGDKLSEKSHKVFNRHSHGTKTASATTSKAPTSDFKKVANDTTFQSETGTQQTDALQTQADQTTQQTDAQAANQNQLDATKAVKPENGIAEGSHTYTIRSGDCLWNIAKDHLGSAAKWSDIYKMNSDILGANPDLIRPGTQIQLPGADTTNIASHYTVKAGDNLFDIAKNQLGDGNKWGELYKNNTEIIGSNPRLIQPGQELNIPGSQPNLQISAQPQAVTPQINPQAATPQGMAQVSQIPQAQPAISQVPTMQNQINMQPEVQSYAQPAEANWQSSSMQNFENMPMGEAQKVVPATSQPDGIIPPAQAADSTFASGLSQGNKAVNSSMGADVLDFLKKRR